ncbi:hypothetical protein C3942_17930 [Solimonas fluminis]|uniref:site-specific DNA-methyltransferase (adenine-specific) n=1 Tax=Solimonas fluminis TaxID=2086571 RepID=A0A2S5TBT0_9GAMM|nr:N-6 DNA methylase [Solimonas fluminis]PPE72425.1 hypothetical protein C3942_17930 [Solimonas fluminis]
MGRPLHPQLGSAANELAPISIARKRELGAFYTPPEIARVLCDWAIRDSSEKVLEPSFGGCTFLEASANRMKALGASPGECLYGCDIDPNAFSFLRERLPTVSLKKFYLCDFLELGFDRVPSGGMSAVIGNPPYVRFSKLSALQKKAVSDWEKKYEISLNRRASLWAYFSFHALHFLQEGGRLAWVLPVSFFTAQYAAPLRKKLSRSFHKIAYITLTERIFLSEGTEERAVIILADGFGQHQDEAHTTFQCLEKASDLGAVVSQWQHHNIETTESDGLNGHGLVPKEIGQILTDLQDSIGVTLFGDLAHIAIGVVSGDAKFFIRTSEDWRLSGISETHLSYVAPPSRWMPGISLSKADRVLHERQGIACVALSPQGNPRSLALKNYLESYDQAKLKRNATFKKRSEWFRFLDDNEPDAFLVFMTHLGPRLVVNAAAANATNALYRVNFKRSGKTRAKLVAIAMQTTFTQLSAEKLGTARGSGALKLEPSDVKKLPLFLPKRSALQVRKAFAVIDQYLRGGETALARRHADQFIFSRSKKFRSVMDRLESSLETARRRRIRNGFEG